MNEVEKVLALTRQGKIKWRRVDLGVYEANVEDAQLDLLYNWKDFKLTLKHSIDYSSSFGRRDNHALTIQSEAIQKKNVFWEDHYTKFADFQHGIEVNYSMRWRYDHGLINKMRMNTTSFKALEELFSLVSLIVS